jgi:hypothetical protein
VRFNPGCGCCVPKSPCSACPAVGLPTDLYITIHNVSGAACLDGLSVHVRYNSVSLQWDTTTLPAQLFNCCGQNNNTIRGTLSCGASSPPTVSLSIDIFGADGGGIECLQFGLNNQTIDCSSATATTGTLASALNSCAGIACLNNSQVTLSVSP